MFGKIRYQIRYQQKLFKTTNPITCYVIGL